MELEVTWKRVVRVWWAYLWRKLLAMVVAMIVGGLVGGIIGFALGLAGMPTDDIKMFATPIGMIIGLAISIVPVKMILGKSFGDFRLVLVANTEKN
jgi:hypothetical protein